MPDFTTLRHSGTGGEWYGPVTYAKHNPAWQPVEDDVTVPTLADGNVQDVLARVGDDPVKAAAALEAEKNRPHPRSTLVDQLTSKIDEE